MIGPAAAWIGILVLTGVGMVLAASWSERDGLARLDDVAVRQLELYAAALESELGRHAYLPSLLELDPDIASLLASPERSALRETVSRKLANFNVRASAISIFVMNPTGTVVAASDWYRPGSSFGQNLSARPYFEQAMRGEQSQVFAANAVNGSSEYYFAQPFRRNDRILGVVGVQISLDPMESTWIDLAFRPDSEKLLVIDDQDVVIISSDPGWKYKTLAPPSPSRRAQLANLGKYPPKTLDPLGMKVEQPLERGAQLVSLPGSSTGSPTVRVAQERTMTRPGWRLMILSDPSAAYRDARHAGWGGGALGAFLGLLCLYLLQRRQAIAKLLSARNALQRAHDQLELKVDQRTVELLQANRELRHEMQERQRAEEELVQAGKLALLGQMSASISHEISQPITALRALSKNTGVLLQAGRTDEALANLKTIGGVAERMGRITAQLKAFARKSHVTGGSVSLKNAIRNVQLLLESRIRAEQVAVQTEIADPAPVKCDSNRLEQVLVNLMSNAMDAMENSPTRILSIKAWRQDGRMMVRVSDTGPGIPETALDRLFEPFFTTKPPGKGLGLGLLISANIVREFGGRLRPLNLAQGAAFEFDLELSEGTSNV